MGRITAEAHAKVNLSLDILGKRADGYHALRSVVMPISLCDSVTLEEADRTSVEMTSSAGIAMGAMAGDIEKNLAVKALRAMQRKADRRTEYAISIDKRIPLGGGLGGGSADAAAVIRALNDAWNCGFAFDEMCAIGAEVGSDVPALIAGETVLMEGRGEIVTKLDLPKFELDLVLAFPGVFSSTPLVFKECDSRPRSGEPATDGMIKALRKGDVGSIASLLSNDLATASYAIYPEIGDAVEKVAVSGALGAVMSGSGSTVYGIFGGAAQARMSCEKLSKIGLNSIVAKGGNV